MLYQDLEYETDSDGAELNIITSVSDVSACPPNNIGNSCGKVVFEDTIFIQMVVDQVLEKKKTKIILVVSYLFSRE